MRSIIGILLILPLCIFSQTKIAPGNWREILPFYNYNHIVDAGDKAYFASEYAIIVYDRIDESYSRLSKINGLTEVGISAIAWSEDKKSVVIGYNTSNIDILQNNTIKNIPTIKEKVGLGNKAINNIQCINGMAYVCCGFGIMVIDLSDFEIKDTYYPGDGVNPPRVNDICYDGTFFYAATSTGLYKANASNPNLANYMNWNKINDVPKPSSSFNRVISFASKLYAIQNDTSLNTLYVFDGATWMLSSLNGSIGVKSIQKTENHLLLLNNSGFNVYNTGMDVITSYSESDIRQAQINDKGEVWYSTFGMFNLWKNDITDIRVYIGGPWSAQSFHIKSIDGVAWIGHGGFMGSNYTSNFSDLGTSILNVDRWELVNPYYNTVFKGMFDVIDIAIHPTNHAKAFFATLNGNGLIEVNDYGKTLKLYNKENSDEALMPDNLNNNENYRIGGVCYDQKNNLWITRIYASSPMAVLKADGKFKDYDFKNYLPSSTILGQVVATSFGQKWVALGLGQGIFIFDDNETPDNEADDEYRRVDIIVREADNNTYYNYVYCMAEDKDGNMWLGTQNGPIVYYNPEKLLSENIQADRIKIPKYDGNYGANPLLDNETVFSIAVDGANRKWMGTGNSGAFLFSADGKKQIYNFREENSPIFSNTVRSVAVDNKTGEVFFATTKGTAIFRGHATEGDGTFGKVYAFPNPVRPGFEGDIIIAGLFADVNVKITDITGNLVYETTSLGGQAKWDGKDMSGRKVNTGVYLVFCADNLGVQTAVTKIMFIH